ncbi:hypothetical protein ACFWE3_12320 [Mycobacteriaceae bacterium NPDC060252]
MSGHEHSENQLKAITKCRDLADSAVQTHELPTYELESRMGDEGDTVRRLASFAVGSILVVGAVGALHGLYRSGDSPTELIGWAGLLLLALSALGGGIKLVMWGAKPATAAVFDGAKRRLSEPVRAVIAALGVVAGALGMWWVFRGGYSSWWQHLSGEKQWSLLLGIGQMLVAVLAGAALFTGGRFLAGLAKEVLVDSGLLVERDRARHSGDLAPSHPALVAALVAGGAGLVIMTAWLTPQLAPTILGADVLPAITAIAAVLVWAIGSNLGWWKGLSGLWEWASNASRKAGATAGVVAVLMFSAGGLGLGWFTPATVPVARAACPPDCGGPGGSDGPPGGGQMFQPPSQGGPQMPDYQGGVNQPPMDQNGSVSIYNTQAPSISNNGANGSSGQQGSQQGWDQPAHGSQPPDYQNATPYTQGPGKPNPEYNPGSQGGQANSGSQGGQSNEGVHQPAQQPQQASQQQPPRQDAGQQPNQQPNQSSDQQKIDELTRQLQEKQQQSGQDRQRLDDLTKQLQQNKQNQKQQQSPKFPSKDKKKDDKDQQDDRDEQSGSTDLASLLLGAASTRRRKQDEQQGPDTEALGQDASQAVQGLPGDVQTYVQSGQQIGESSGQAAQGFGSAAQAGASLASSAQSGAVNPQDAMTVVQGVSQGIQGTADAINAGSQIVKTAQGEADQVAQAVGDANPQLKPQTEQFTQLNDQASQVTDLVGQGSQLTSQGAGAVNSVSSVGSSGVPSDATEPAQALTEDRALSQMQDKLSQGLIDPDIDGDGVDDTEVFVKTLWEKAHQNNEMLPQGPVTFNSSKGPTTLSWDDINKFADQKTPEHPEAVRELLPLPLAPTLADKFRPWQYNLDLVPFSQTTGVAGDKGYVPDLGKDINLDQVWNELHRCFNCNFPIAGATEGFPKVGDRFPLVIEPASGIGIHEGAEVPVFVTQIEKTADKIFIEYATAPGHVDGVGSTISFTFTKSDTLHLAVKGIIVGGPGSGDKPWDAALRVLYSGAGKPTWQPYLENLVRHIAGPK